ncbi:MULTISPECIES: ECs1072 family phage-associated protein [Pectobacterium]|uniref:Uncharacterized protein n=1 Tax=Pectobacterium carotovorum subsp. carotovorum (strain PC1) TaxID=561230 RepID=C6D9D1_PECCP|nr:MULTISPECIES: hypothetical protein [Pectobacterium]ACT13658.1 hypothetical protein PC1_2628 [Pectobacterium carotovorum subsp. carotovorum PC1]POE18471.1 hypothetical protein BV923_21365 [Pectobacterium odoriferum]
MDLNLTNAFRVFENTIKNVVSHLNVNDNERFGYELEHYISNRSFIIFKLDVMLFEYRESLDKHRLALFGKNALIHYLVNKKNISLTEAKNIEFHDAIVILWDDISDYKISDEIISYINRSYSFSNHDISIYYERYKGYSYDEWDANYADRRLR